MYENEHIALEKLQSFRTTDRLYQFLSELTLNHITIASFISQHLFLQDLKAADFFESSGISRPYGYQIINGQRNPGRDKVLAMCLTLHFDLLHTQKALIYAGHAALSTLLKRDIILLYSIFHHYSVQDTNLLLYACKEPCL